MRENIKRPLYIALIAVMLITLLLILCACSEPTLQYKFIFDVDGEEYSVYDSYDGKVSLPKSPTKDGYEFDAWIITDELGNRLSLGEWRDLPVGSTVTFTATWIRLPINIMYAGADSGEHDNPTQYSESDGVKLLTPASRPWYTFDGWYLDSSFTKPIATLEASLADNTVIYAKWSLAKYRAYYYDISGAVASFEFDVNNKSWLAPPITQRDGYSAKWEFTPIRPNDLHIYAEYTPIEYAIIYNGIDASNENKNPTVYTVESAGASLEKPKRNGYEFTGWRFNGSPVNTIPTGVTGNIELDATWAPIRYSITYSNTIGADTGALPTSYTIEDGGLPLPSLSDIKGARFDGWQINGTPVTELKGGSYGDITVDASWEYIQYSITYHGLSATDKNPNPSEYNVGDGTLSLLSPTRRGYTFKGWTRDGEAVTSIFAMTDEDVSLTASWELTQYRITYKNTNGFDTSALPTVYTIYTVVELPESIFAGGYIFNGWTYDSSDGSSNGCVTSIPSGIASDITVSASFTPISYIVTLHPMGGKVSSSSYAVKYGESYELPTAVKEGFVFVGWYSNTGDTAEALTDGNGISVEGYGYAANRVLYAHYKPIECTVTFDTNGGDPMNSAIYEYGEYFDSSAHIPTTGEGMYFAGWQVSGGTDHYTDSTAIVSDVTLKAIWVDSIPISTAEQFLAIKNAPSKTYHLINDISLGGESFTPWESFSGVLDGNGYALKNFTLSNTSSHHYALILNNSGTVRNLNIKSFSMSVTVEYTNDTSSSHYAILAATNTGTIDNCTVDSDGGSVKLLIQQNYTREWAGSINTLYGAVVGYNKGTVKNCKSFVDLELIGKAHHKYDSWGDAALRHVLAAGGAVGENSGTGVINSCESDQKITLDSYAWYTAYHFYEQAPSTDMLVGGMIGRNYGNCRNSHSRVDLISNSDAASHSYAYGSVGGFAGINFANIEYCFSVGTINGGIRNSGCIGGFLGYNRSTGSTVRGCHTGVAVNHKHGSSSVGGFVGANEGKVLNSYSNGDVNSSSGSSVGGFVGSNTQGGTVTQSYAGGNVAKATGSGGAFVGSCSSTSVIYKCYYLESASLMVGGVYVPHITESGNTVGKSYIELWSDELLMETLEWGDDKWVILFDESPILEWEIGIGHTYKTEVIEPSCTEMGFTVYECTHCARFFIRNFVKPWGHTYAQELEETVPPTCTREGYTSNICTVCKTEARTDITEPTGHTCGTLISHTDATCTTDGRDVYECAVCSLEFDVVTAAHGHIEYVTKQYVKPTCGKDTSTNEYYCTVGYTEEISCAICEKVITESVEVAPHQFTITATTPATCTEDGIGTYTCTLENCGYTLTDEAIPATGHEDIDHDGCCDTCRAFVGRPDISFIEINTAEDLLQINRNPNGDYILMADIDLAGVEFTPLCSEILPFTGYFDGNGHTISNLYVKDKSCGGLFSYNRGIIRDLTVSGALAEYGKSGTFGVLVAHNSGVISGCTVTGKLNLNIVMITDITSHKDVTVGEFVTLGGLVGINTATGMISDCSVTAQVGIYTANHLNVQTGRSALAILLRHYNKEYKATLNVTFGLVAGNNGGAVERARIALSGNMTYGIDVRSTDTAARLGHSHTYLNLNYGMISGGGNGSVVDSDGSFGVSCAGWYKYDDLVLWLEGEEYKISYIFDGYSVSENESFLIK